MSRAVDGEDRQTSLEAFARSDGDGDSDRCTAIAEDTGERCEHDALGPLPVCRQHRDTYDPEAERDRPIERPPREGDA